MLPKASWSDVQPALDLTPVIDMVFNLLIFFLVATTFQQTEREMKIALPVAQSTLPVTTMLREIVLNVDVDGNVIIGGQPKPLEEVKTLVTDAVSANPEQKVTIRGDRQVPYGLLVRVLDVCKGSGIQEPYLDTVLE